MDELFLPWWTVLLLGMWAAALTLWIHPSVHREMRFWAGISTIVYLALIFIALGGGSKVTSVAPETPWFSLRNLGLAIGFAISLLASVWSLGRVSLATKQSCYSVLTFANASICVFLQQFEVAMGLLVVAGLTVRPLIQAWTLSGPVTWRERLDGFIQFLNFPIPPERRGEFGLIGGIAGLMAFTLLGTISYSIHFEMTRSTSNQHQSALPSQEQIQTVLGKQQSMNKSVSVVDLLLGARSDLVVLMAIVVFLTLAISMIDGRDTKPDPAPDTSVPAVPTSPGEI